MSTYYDLCDNNNRIRFYMGKGPYAAALEEVLDDVPTSRDDFVAAYNEVVNRKKGHKEDVTVLARRLWDFCTNARWNVTMVNDACGGLPDNVRGWPEVGSRYGND